MLVSDEYLELFEKTYGDKLWRLNNLYHIRDKSGAIVLFKMNAAQSKFYSERHNRNIQLKARQKGFTTLAVIDSLDDCLFNDYFEAGIIAHSIDDAEKLFKKAKLAFSMLPEILQKTLKPDTDKAGEMRFPNGSAFSVDTSFRGGTLSRLHVSEMGKIAKKYPEKAKEIITGAFEAVPMNGIIDVESTAEGMVGAFYDLCQEAMSKSSGNLTPLEFKFHFDPWWSSDEYQIDAEVDATDYHKYFDYLETDHGIKLTHRQRNWYILKAGSLQDNMHQEYPSYPEEAFMASGRPVFNMEKVSRDIRRAKEKKFELKSFDIASTDNKGNSRSTRISVKVFKAPQKDMAYAVAGDPAEGLESGDNSALSVLDKNFEQVAVCAGKYDPDIFGKLMVEVGKYYNQAVLAPEQNNHGHAVLQAIKNAGYYRVYKREVQEELGKDIMDKVGWLNTVKTKMKMLDDLKESYRDGSLIINDEATLREMLLVVTEENGDIVVNGKDRVVALGISIQAIRQASLEGEYQAFIPGKEAAKDVTKMDVNQKLAFYKRQGKL